MYLTSLTRASAAIRTAEKRLVTEAGPDSVKELVEGTADVLGPHLGETVSSARELQLTFSWAILLPTRSLCPALLLLIGRESSLKTWTDFTSSALILSPGYQNTSQKSFHSSKESWTMALHTKVEGASGLTLTSLKAQKARISGTNTPSFNREARATRSCWMREKVKYSQPTLLR